jgi:hypothetical protein
MLRRALQILASLAALAVIPAHAVQFTYDGVVQTQDVGCSAHGGSGCGNTSCSGTCPATSYGCPATTATGVSSWGWKYDSGADIQYCWHVSSTCPDGQQFVSGVCQVPPPVTCPEHQHDVNGSCVPDNPQPSIGQQMGDQYVYLGEECSINPDPCFARLNAGIPVNCGGYNCTVGLANYSGECIKGGPSQTSTFCTFNPVYTGGGVYVPNQSSSPTPSNTAATVICPAGYVLGADGVCRAGQTTGTASSLSDPTKPATSGTATCPAGYTLGADGACHGSTSQASCPAGYTTGPNGVCTSTVTIGSGGTTGTGGTGSGVCGGPGQPSCSVKIDGSDINPNAASGIAADYTAIDQQHQTSTDSIANWIDPSSGSQDAFRNSFVDWVTPIPITGCSPWSADIAGNTWTVDFCSKAAIIASWLEYVMWFLLMLSTFKLLTTRYP